ncbi:wsv504 [White spot syndrome virus]|uniref:Wsv504 n=4 Tax=White spot syndrome virus TaxID=342409 RepID=Q8VAC1_WSSVS|nr:wsv504 [Shrimp white spot syndrome virus]AFX59866.1 wsv504 [White spot syndrome virus]AAL33505.1 wsv504 [Shrimp white spot syndrome virus]AWQ60601.1 wsv504 [Shrimp white spot syndrome virus]AWQ61038.1 wsv504 [Shrimp white spot syndrome virus]AWQ61433.1 wsv504 [Shrimp white spot syndrome virus]
MISLKKYDSALRRKTSQKTVVCAFVKLTRRPIFLIVNMWQGTISSPSTHSPHHMMTSVVEQRFVPNVYSRTSFPCMRK